MADLKISELTAATDVSSSEFEIVQGGTNKRAANTLIYHPSGTDVALADGGTGASLTDPGADRIMFWDDSAGAVTWLEVGSGLSLSGTTLTATGGGGGGGGVTISSTAPSTPSAGDMWFSAEDGALAVYYNDVDTSQWVVVGNLGSINPAANRAFSIFWGI